MDDLLLFYVGGEDGDMREAIYVYICMYVYVLLRLPLSCIIIFSHYVFIVSISHVILIVIVNTIFTTFTGITIIVCIIVAF